MTKRISTLNPGDNVRLKFHGSKKIGNDPYEMDVKFIEFNEDRTRAIFDEVEVYKFGNRWCYGSGAHTVSILATLDES